MIKHIYLTSIIDIKNIYFYIFEYIFYKTIFMFFNKIDDPAGDASQIFVANLRSRLHDIACDGVEKEKYESHHEYIVNRANMRDVEEISEQ